MVFVFAAAAFLLMFAPSRFRGIGFTVLAVVLIGFLGIVMLNRRAAPPPTPVTPAYPETHASRRFDFDQYERDKKDREDPDARTKIALTEVRFDQLQALPGIDPGTIQTIRARIYNDSHRFTLTDYVYYLVVQDCLPSKPNDGAKGPCTTVYDRRASVSSPVPPDQARDLVISVTPDATTPAPFKLLGTPRIELTPTETRAYRSGQER